jgi:SAM-dependent methyltransferase
VQSNLHMLLTTGPFSLVEGEVADIVLEAPAGQRRRIDVEAGFTVFEVKRDLRVGRVRQDAVVQLTGYVASRVETMRQRYVGVLTDGAEWHLYSLVGDELALISSLVVDARTPDVDALCLWLEVVLGTTEKVTPTPREIAARLGADSPAHALDFADLTALYQANGDLPAVMLKRRLWAKLLTTALGTAFSDDDRLFVEHTLLVTMAEIIAHAVVGIDTADPAVSPAVLVRGGLFGQAQVTGVVDHDFFDWVAEVPGGEQWIRTLARRLAKFAWDQVDHDVMKVLYESVISTDERHRLGEYYTPDWLADEVVSKVVTDPLTQRVLDPGCGSGTFLFHAVRRYLRAAEAAGTSSAEAVVGATSHVAGIDVHPVAVTFARVTYLLAIGMERLRAPDRPPVAIPVYLGDSVQWGHGETLMHADGLSILADDGSWADELRFPERLLTDAGKFDQLVSTLSDRAANRAPGTPVPSLTAVFRRFSVDRDDEQVLVETFATMCRLHDEGRDHIWGYYVRNLARPVWMAQPANRVDALVGNPPWLAYKFMPGAMQSAFRELSDSRNLWAGATVAPHQDLSALFVARCAELYLRLGGRFGFVMPLAALTRRQFAGFRTGRYRVNVAYDQPWDLHAVKPSFFPVPACVVFGEHAEMSLPLAGPAESWSGRLPVANASKEVAARHLTRQAMAESPTEWAVSPYAWRFAQGATIVPRVLFMVEERPVPALGAGAGRKAVRSQRSATEKQPWRDLPALDGVVEVPFLRRTYLGDNVLPFRTLPARLAVIPWDDKRLLDGTDDRIEDYPGLESWWRAAEAAWNAHRSSDRLTLREQLDYRKKLTDQMPPLPQRIVYSKGGMYLAAARVTDQWAVVDHTLYWATVNTMDEGRFLTAMLNSDVLTQLVRPLQARGEHNPRHFDKYIFRLPIPLYDPVSAAHRQLVALAERAEQVAEAVELPVGVSFQAQRRRVREALASDGVAGELNQATMALLAPAGQACPTGP